MTQTAPINSAARISESVTGGQLKACDVVARTLSAIDQLDAEINCFTLVLRERAMNRAAALDCSLAAGASVGPLAGVPFAVKNLFDIAEHSTVAGSLINTEHPPASEDAVLIQRLEAAGAILVGALGMGEYAYDFTGENHHYGAVRNPWDTSRMSGGSSSGSGAALAARLVPLALGSDTNGSIRVPASLCGGFGLKPTYGALPRTGSFPFCDSLDHLGPMANCAVDLALSFDAMQGWDAGDRACVNRAPVATLPELHKGIDGLRLAVAGGYFDCASFPAAERAVATVSAALGVEQALQLEGAAEGRAAAYLITNAEGGALHRERLQRRLIDFDPDTRDRFIAGNLLPAGWYQRAQAVRARWRQQMAEVFGQVDIIVAPATPCVAPYLGAQTLRINGKDEALRPNLGLFTQPFSAIGLPVCSVPLADPDSGLPIGVQLVAAPWREDLCLRVAAFLESSGVTLASSPELGEV
ncbi:MAG: AtzE family amidohydrolase [Pseudomonadota bacterium]